MKKGSRLIAQAEGIILFSTMILMVFVAVSGKYLAEFPWSAFRERLGFFAVVIVVVESIGFFLVWSRLRVFNAYYRARDKGEAVDPEVRARCLETAYGFPPSAAMNLFMFAFIAAIILSFDLARYGVSGSWLGGFRILIPTLIYFSICAVIGYYALKFILREPLLDLAEDDPRMLLGDFDRTYNFPIGPIFFIRRPVKWRIAVRYKLFISMVLLSLTGIIFLYLAKRITGEDSLFNWLIAVQIIFALAVSLLLSYLAARDMSDPLNEITRASGAIIKTDLGNRARVVTDDELGDVAASFNRMSEELVRGLEDRIESLEEMMGSAERVAREIQTASKVILEVMVELGKGSSRQRESVGEATEKAGELGRASQVIAGHARQIETQSNEALKVCESGTLTIQELINSMDALRQHIHQTADQMGVLLDQARKIRGVVELIDEISDQINLLSLNASLEAAGAGDLGRRFNTVAEEITRLAKTTVNSTEQVALLISEVIGAAEKVAEFSSQAKGSVDVSVNRMEEVGSFLVNLLERVENVTRQAQGITGSTEEQSQSSSSLTDRLRGIEQSALEVETSILEINSSINELERVASELTTQVVTVTGEKSG